MNDKLANFGQSILRKFGYELHYKFPSDFTQEEIDTILFVKNYTQTSARRIKTLINAIEYVVNYQIEGSVVECGVWRGGSIMAIAKTLQRLNNFERDLYLFDTFEGMSDPTEVDLSVKKEEAIKKMNKAKEENDNSFIVRISLEEVMKAVYGTGYPKSKIHFVKGKVEETLPHKAPDKISLLRLDTDWYESTKHELTTLFPRVSSGGVIIIDDYGYWLGAKKAVDEYFKVNNIPFFPIRIDSSGRMGIKIK